VAFRGSNGRYRSEVRQGQPIVQLDPGQERADPFELLDAGPGLDDQRLQAIVRFSSSPVVDISRRVRKSY